MLTFSKYIFVILAVASLSSLNSSHAMHGAPCAFEISCIENQGFGLYYHENARYRYDKILNFSTPRSKSSWIKVVPCKFEEESYEFSCPHYNAKIKLTPYFCSHCGGDTHTITIWKNGVKIIDFHANQAKQLTKVEFNQTQVINLEYTSTNIESFGGRYINMPNIGVLEIYFNDNGTIKDSNYDRCTTYPRECISPEEYKKEPYPSSYQYYCKRVENFQLPLTEDIK